MKIESLNQIMFLMVIKLLNESKILKRKKFFERKQSFWVKVRCLKGRTFFDLSTK